MPRYAQIVDGFVILTVEPGLSLDSFDPSLLIVDVTGADPRPELGWLYQPGEDVLFVPPESMIVPDPPSSLTLEEARGQVLARIQEEKSRRLSAGFMVGPVLFDSDMSARVASAVRVPGPGGGKLPLVSPSLGWLSWPGVVDVVRSSLADSGDAHKYADDG